jgi:hypothetical protein
MYFHENLRQRFTNRELYALECKQWISKAYGDSGDNIFMNSALHASRFISWSGQINWYWSSPAQTVSISGPLGTYDHILVISRACAYFQMEPPLRREEESDCCWLSPENEALICTGQEAG